MNSSMSWITGQLATRFTEPTGQPRFNPRPPGVILPGSATSAVLQMLRESPGRYWSCYELCKYTGRSIKSVNWACLYLRAQELIVVVPDGYRNPRYLKYSINTEK